MKCTYLPSVNKKFSFIYTSWKAETFCHYEFIRTKKVAIILLKRRGTTNLCCGKFVNFLSLNIFEKCFRKCLRSILNWVGFRKHSLKLVCKNFILKLCLSITKMFDSYVLILYFWWNFHVKVFFKFLFLFHQRSFCIIIILQIFHEISHFHRATNFSLANKSIHCLFLIIKHYL